MEFGENMSASGKTKLQHPVRSHHPEARERLRAQGRGGCDRDGTARGQTLGGFLQLSYTTVN